MAITLSWNGLDWLHIYIGFSNSGTEDVALMQMNPLLTIVMSNDVCQGFANEASLHSPFSIAITDDGNIIDDAEMMKTV